MWVFCFVISNKKVEKFLYLLYNIIMMELLAPAGDKQKLIMAIHYGADAVYLASTRFGLRTFAGNFDLEELKKVTLKSLESISSLSPKQERQQVISKLQTIMASIKESIGGLSDKSTQLHSNSEETVIQINAIKEKSSIKINIDIAIAMKPAIDNIEANGEFLKIIILI